jgi:hypothetical protein
VGKRGGERERQRKKWGGRWRRWACTQPKAFALFQLTKEKKY